MGVGGHMYNPSGTHPHGESHGVQKVSSFRIAQIRYFCFCFKFYLHDNRLLRIAAKKKPSLRTSYKIQTFWNVA